MFRLILQWAAGLMILGLINGCASTYTVVKQTSPTGNLKQYQELNVGWIDLGEGKYEKYGYEAKDKGAWKALLNKINLESLPEFLKAYMPNKTINTAKAIGNTPASKGLVIKFTDANYNQLTNSAAQVLFGGMGGSDTLDVTVYFIDGQSGNELYSSTIAIDSRAGTGYGSMGFEGRVTNTIYNLAGFISEKTR